MHHGQMEMQSCFPFKINTVIHHINRIKEENNINTENVLSNNQHLLCDFF